jgi:hypothetical protein
LLVVFHYVSNAGQENVPGSILTPLPPLRVRRTPVNQ